MATSLGHLALGAMHLLFLNLGLFARALTPLSILLSYYDMSLFLILISISHPPFPATSLIYLYHHSLSHSQVTLALIRHLTFDILGRCCTCIAFDSHLGSFVAFLNPIRYVLLPCCSLPNSHLFITTVLFGDLLRSCLLQHPISTRSMLPSNYNSILFMNLSSFLALTRELFYPPYAVITRFLEAGQCSAYLSGLCHVTIDTLLLPGTN